jgi:serine/threonine-protein kinase RsbW
LETHELRFSPFLNLSRTEKAAMEKRRILIVEDNDEMRSTFEREFQRLGYEVEAVADRTSALQREGLDSFDVIVSDLTDDTDFCTLDLSSRHRKRLMAGADNTDDGSPLYDLVKSFKLDTVNYDRQPFSQNELSELVETTLGIKTRFAETELDRNTREMIDLELPSDISLMSSVLQFLIDRVSKLGVINPDRSNLFVALDEAFVNAVKHGNRHDLTKHIRIKADLSAQEARFTVEDEGEGFNVQEIPDPCDPENLFKNSGRGVLLIYNIMDEVQYNSRGNRLTMVKRPEGTPELVESNQTKDKPVLK